MTRIFCHSHRCLRVINLAHVIEVQRNHTNHAPEADYVLMFGNEKIDDAYLSEAQYLTLSLPCLPVEE